MPVRGILYDGTAFGIWNSALALALPRIVFAKLFTITIQPSISKKIFPSRIYTRNSRRSRVGDLGKKRNQE